MQTVTIGGKTYPILFDANVLAKIQERYGSVDDLGENLTKIQETIWILTQISAFNEGMGGRKNPGAGQRKKSRNGKRKKKASSTLPGSSTSP